MWWSGNFEGYGGVGVLVKEELYDEVVEVRRVNDRVMSLAIVFEEVVRVVWSYGTKRNVVRVAWAYGTKRNVVSCMGIWNKKKCGERCMGTCKKKMR